MDRKTYEALIDQLIRYSDSYYKDHVSLVSDAQFDMMLKQAEQIEKEHPDWVRKDSPTRQVGSDLSSSTQENRHGRPMLSLENTYNEEDVAKWYGNMCQYEDDPEIIVECKYDGNSASIRYQHGHIVKALTRGNGEVGEDITNNIRCMEDTTKIASHFSQETRGEIIMPKAEFARINVDGRYANPRNLAAGTLKLLDTKEFKKRELWFYAYWLEGSSNPTHSMDLEELKKAGFRVGTYYLCHGLKSVMDAIRQIEKDAEHLPIEIDGAVMKLNDKSLWERIGSTAKFPRWAKAFKYQQEMATTLVESIEFQVGRTGKITPVANLKPVLIDGSTVSRATLNNEDFIREMDIRVGDTVYVHKAAAIIPEIIGVNLDLSRGEHVTNFPRVCPECGTPLVREKEEANYFCHNEKCPARIIDQLSYFTHTLEIDGFGDEILERFHHEGYLNSILDLYLLGSHREELIAFDRMGEKSVDKLLRNVENSKSQPAEKLLAALGIRGIGQKMAKVIKKGYQNIWELLQLSDVEFQNIPGIGEIKASDMYRQLHKEETIQLLQELERLGVNFAFSVDETAVNENVKGKSFCITGALSRPRKEYEALIEQNGGSNVSSVTSKTSYLVTNDTTSGSSKNKKAKELSIPVITEEQLQELLGIK